MSQSSSAQLAPTTAVNEAVKARLAPVKATHVEVDIKSNPVAAIVLAPTRAEEKSAEIAKFLAAETSEQQRVAIKALEDYKEFLASQRTMQQRKLIELSSTTVFAKMNKTFGDMNQGVIDFREMMRPLVENLEAIYTLRTNGAVLDTFAEIEEDRRREAEWAEREADLQRKAVAIVTEQDAIEKQNAELAADRGFFGGVRKSSLVAIEQNKLALARKTADLEKIRNELNALASEQAEYRAKDSKFKVEKEQIRKMLDISGEEHVERVENIIKAALDYIDKSQVTVGELRTELTDIDKQADNIVRVNNQMTTVVAILDRGIDSAVKTIKDKVQTFAVVPEGEDALGRVSRERTKNDLERHVTALADSSVGTKKTVSELEKDAVNANMFQEAVGKQIVNLRELSSDGIASIATSLNTSIQALNNSALNEASETVRDSMRSMNQVTDGVVNKEVIRQALVVDEQSRRIMEKVESLSSIGESLQAANQLREQGLGRIAQSLGALKDVTVAVRQHLQDSIGMDAKDLAAAPEAPKAAAQAESAESPFGNL